MGRWTEEELDCLRCAYEAGMEPTEIAALDIVRGRTTKAITNQACRLGIAKPLRKYVHNRYFFSIYTKGSCYWAGFLAADGCVNAKQGKIILVISERDRVHLEKYKGAVGFTGPIRDVLQNNACVVQVSDTDMIADLATNFCITPCKSLTLMPPTNMPTVFQKDFVRGYIDGDGYLSKKGTELTVLGTHAFLTWLLDVVASEVDLTGTQHVAQRDNYFTLGFYGARQVNRVCDWLYGHSDNLTRLDRKFDIYRRWSSLVSN